MNGNRTKFYFDAGLGLERSDLIDALAALGIAARPEGDTAIATLTGHQWAALDAAIAADRFPYEF